MKIIEKSIVSGVSTPDTMLFIVGRFTFFSSEIELLPRLFQFIKA
ncbi:hypothetical protein [Streptococcus pneumoniae]